MTMRRVFGRVAVVLALLGASLVGVVGSASKSQAASSLSGETIATGVLHSCALVAGGTVKCWGYNFYGQLGNGATLPGVDSLVPVVVTGLSGVIQISAGGYHTCALVAGGTVKCWGSNSSGQLGNGLSGVGSLVPVVVTGLSGVIQTAAGGDHSCALVLSGIVKCWGSNSFGQLGNGATLPGVDSLVPVVVTGLSGVIQIAAGKNRSCGLVTGGTVKCWGYNFYGGLGNGLSGALTDSSVPVVVTGLSGVTQIVAGGDHSCGLVAGGTVKCWGSNSFGQLGNGATLPGVDSSVPVVVTDLSGVIQISAGGDHSCGLLLGGTVKCWGSNSFGQLGNGLSGALTDSSVPVVVSTLSGVTQIAAGGFESCALVTTGAVLMLTVVVKCWGYNLYGQLGNGSSGGSSSVPVVVSGSSGVVPLPDYVSLVPGRLLD